MPELPEVQTVVSQLRKKVVGKRIAGFWTDWKKGVKVPMPKFRQLIKEARITGTRRFGKTIVIDLDTNDSIIIHLKMTGHLLYKDKKNAESPAWRDPINQFIHHRFDFADGSRLDFSDMRKFGWIDLAPSAEILKHMHIRALGVDALSKEFDLACFVNILNAAKRRPIGILLLDQAKISGIGNIYRSEALYRAGILPWRKIGTLKKNEIARLHLTIKEVLREAVRLRGTSDGDFRDTAGKPGGFQKTLFVYAREGESCKRCGTIVQRKVLGARSVFLCPQCQK